jgi:ATP-binding cassette, subfamily B, bacterial
MTKIKNVCKDLVKGFLLSWQAGKRYAIYNLLLSLVLAVLPLLSLWYIKELIDIVTHYEHVSRKDFIYALGVLILIQLVQAGLQQLLKDIQATQQQLMIDYLSHHVLKKAVSVEYAYYEDAAYFNSLHMAQQEVLYRTAILTNGYNQLLQNGLTLIALTALFLQYNWIYAIMVLAAGIPVVMVKWKHAVASQQLEKDNLLNERKAAYLNRVLTDATHAKEVRTFDFGEVFIDKFRELRRSIFRGKKKLSARQHMSETMIQVVEIIIIGAIVLSLGLKTFDGLLTIGSFILYLQALQRLQSGFTGFLNGFTVLFRQRFFIKNIRDFIDLPLPPRPASTISFPATILTGIAVENVSYTYTGNKSPSLSGLNMHFKPGTVTAIIGENGCGKSTLVKLIARLYSLQDGSITINGTDVSLLRLEEYYRNVGFLFQEYNQYHFSIGENISLDGLQDRSKLKAAAHSAGIMDLVQSQPKQFEANLGRMFGNDLQLSGGQCQKLAIARLLYRDTPVMVFDEPTSNIDPIAEFELLQEITAEKEGKIIILVTHRLHNLKFADNVYLLDEGKVQAEGTVADLLQNSEAFRKMYKRQQLERPMINQL